MKTTLLILLSTALFSTFGHAKILYHVPKALKQGSEEFYNTQDNVLKKATAYLAKNQNPQAFLDFCDTIKVMTRPEYEELGFYSDFHDLIKKENTLFVKKYLQGISYKKEKDRIFCAMIAIEELLYEIDIPAEIEKKNAKLPEKDKLPNPKYKELERLYKKFKEQ